MHMRLLTFLMEGGLRTERVLVVQARKDTFTISIGLLSLLSNLLTSSY